MEVSKWTIGKVALMAFLMFGAFFLGALLTGPAYQQGFIQGVESTLDDVKAKLQIADVDFDWQYIGDGQYKLTIKSLNDGQQVTLTAEVDLLVEHYRNGELIGESYGAGTLTTWGKNWIEQELSGTNNATQSLLYLGDSNSASAPDAGWTALPSEITSNGLERQLGTYTSTGDGTWNVTKTKSVTGTQSTQLWGLYAAAYADDTNTLVAADSTPDQKNCVAGDTLTETWQITVS